MKNIQAKFNFVSDTFTVPDANLFEDIHDIQHGDQGYETDETTIELETKVAKIFGKEDACLTLSGTASNLIAVNCIASSGFGVIVPNDSDLYLWESAGVSAFGGIRLIGVNTLNGRISLTDKIWENIDNSEFGQICLPKAVVIEDPHILTGGHFLGMEYISDLYEKCNSHNLPLHIDGARIYNAVAQGIYDPKVIGNNCTTLSFCFSKTLGAPMGSIILGTKKIINKARYFRKMIGGTVRQSGVISLMCLNSLKYAEINIRKSIATACLVKKVLIESNICEVSHPNNSNILLVKCLKGNARMIQVFLEYGLAIGELEAGVLRIVCHKDHTSKSVELFQLAISHV